MSPRSLVGRMISLLGLAAISGSAACSLPLAGADSKVTNACSSDADCGDRGRCVVGPADDHVCAATQADLGAVILEVRPTADGQGNTVSHVFTDALSVSGSYPGGAIPSFVDGTGQKPLSLDLQIPQDLSFSGSSVSSVVNTSCTGSDGSLPVHVELRSVVPYDKLSESYKTDAKSVGDGNGGSVYRFDVDVPTGVYDIYLRPTDLPSGCGASTLPPRLISGQALTTNTELKPDTTAPQTLQGTIAVPDGIDVSGWRIEVVDPDYGYVISDTGRLGAPVLGASAILGGADGTDPKGLRYFYKKSAMIRLRDQNGRLVVHWSLDPLDPSMVELSLADLVANTQAVEANVVDTSTQPVVSSVRIQSVKLTGNAKQNASFRVDTDTDVDGKIHASLVEGTYRVSISPKDPTGPSATLVEDWEVKGTLGFGRTFVLPQRPTLSGTVSSPSGAKALGDVAILASPVVGTSTYLSSVFNPSGALPRQSSGQTDLAGQFQLLVDPGTLDFSAQPSADTGFSWLVVPRLLVSAAAQKPQARLGALTMPSPVLVAGSLASKGNVVVPSAVVRAWVAVKDASQTADQVTSLLQIGEAISDEQGRFVLPLPPSISFRAPTP